MPQEFANSLLKLGDAAMLYGDTESGTILDVILELQNDEVGLGGIEGGA